MTKLKKSRSSSTPLSVLDMCSGKGGDLLKWKKADIDEIVCAGKCGKCVFDIFYYF